MEGFFRTLWNIKKKFASAFISAREFYLFSQSVNGFFNVSKVHALNISYHRYHKTLQGGRHETAGSELTNNCISNQISFRSHTFGVATATLISI